MEGVSKVIIELFEDGEFQTRLRKFLRRGESNELRPPDGENTGPIEITKEKKRMKKLRSKKKKHAKKSPKKPEKQSPSLQDEWVSSTSERMKKSQYAFYP